MYGICSSVWTRMLVHDIYDCTSRMSFPIRIYSIVDLRCLQSYVLNELPYLIDCWYTMFAIVRLKWASVCTYLMVDDAYNRMLQMSGVPCECSSLCRMRSSANEQCSACAYACMCLPRAECLEAFECTLLSSCHLQSAALPMCAHVRVKV